MYTSPEWAWANVQMDYVIVNDGTLSDPKNLVKDHSIFFFFFDTPPPFLQCH